MANEPVHLLTKHLRKLSSAARMDRLPDRELVERFASKRDEEAFAALVRRHGPMVLRVCQRVLHDSHDAEDAFQATFLVLSRKAASLRRVESVGCFLHGVAYRLALKARTQRARQRLHESRAAVEKFAGDPLAELSVREAQAIVDEELDRLPEKYRAPLLLCSVEGRTRDEAARQLGWSVKVVKSRLEQGRERLRSRLSRRGLTVPTVLVATLLEGQAALAALPAGLIRIAVRNAATWPVNGIPASVALLAETALGGMAAGKAKIVVVGMLLLTSVVAAGVSVIAPRKPKVEQAQTPRAVKTPETPKSEEQRPKRTDHFGDALPAKAVARIGTVRWWFGQKRDVLNLCPFVYTPDGKSLILCDDRKTVRFLDAATGKELRRIEPAGDVTCFALAPDGKRLVTGTPLRLWDVATDKELRQLAKDKFPTTILAFSPDGKTIAAGTNTTEWGILLLDADTWKEIRRITGKNATNCSHGLVFSADGKTLFSANGIDLCRWDVHTGRLLRCLGSNFPSDDQHGFSQPAVSPDGKRFAAWEGDAALHLWDAASGETIRRIVLGRSYMPRLCFSPDGRMLACTIDGARNNEILFLAVDTGRELCRWNEDDASDAAHIVFSPDGKILAQVRGGVIRLRDVATGKSLQTTPGLPSGVTAVRFLQGDKSLMTNCPAGRIGIWDPLTGKQLAPFRDPPKDFVHSIMDKWTRTDLTADGSKAALVDGKSVLHVWETATGKTCCRIDPPIRSWRTILSTDGKLLATGEPGNLRLWDATTGKLLRSFQIKPHFVKPLASSPDGRILALHYVGTTAVSEAPVIHLWDATTGKERGRLAWPEDKPPTHLLFTADGKRLIIAYYLGPGWPEGVERERIGLCVWDLASGRELRRFRGSAGPIALSPDEKTLAAAEGGTILLWELASGKERGRFAGHRQEIESLAFSADGRLLASGSLDYTACVWDVTSLCPDGHWTLRHVKRDELERLWSDLGNKDGVRAYRAVWGLAAAGPSAVAFLAPRLRPISEVEGETLTRLIADLDNDSFATRERASTELQRLGERAESALRKALAANPSLEVSRRLRALLDEVESRTLSAEQLHALRVVEVLEHIGTDEARAVLRSLATGAPAATLTREAKAALERLTHNSTAAP